MFIHGLVSTLALLVIMSCGSNAQKESTVSEEDARNLKAVEFENCYFSPAAISIHPTLNDLETYWITFVMNSSITQLFKGRSAAFFLPTSSLPLSINYVHSINYPKTLVSPKMTQKTRYQNGQLMMTRIFDKAGRIWSSRVSQTLSIEVDREFTNVTGASLKEEVQRWLPWQDDFSPDKNLVFDKECTGQAKTLD